MGKDLYFCGGYGINKSRKQKEGIPLLIINSREDQAKRIGYLYAAGLLILALILKFISAPTSTTVPLMVGAMGIALYSIHSIPRKGDGSRVFYEANWKKLRSEEALLAMGPAVWKDSPGNGNVVGTLLLRKDELEFRHLTESGISQEAMLRVELYSFSTVELGRGDTLSFTTDSGVTRTFMVNKPRLWQSEIYKARR